jgi:hypothetical protein
MMPSTSKKQHNFMAAIAHNPAFAKKVGIPQSVGKDFNEADKGKKFGSGGMARPDLQKINKPKTLHGKMSIMKGGGMAKSDMKEDMKADLKQDKSMMQKAVNKHEGRLHKGATMTKLAKGGMAPSKMGSVKTAAPSRNGVASKGKTKGTMIKMNKGGKPC